MKTEPNTFIVHWVKVDGRIIYPLHKAEKEVDDAL